MKTRGIEEIKQKLHTATGTARVSLLTEMCKCYWYSNPETALSYGSQALDLANTLGDKKGKSTALRVIGAVYQFQGNYPAALDYYHKSLVFSQAVQDMKGVAATYNNLANVFRLQGDYPLSLDHHFKALKIREDIQDEAGMAASLNNIANIYYFQNEWDKCLKYHERAREIREQLDDVWGLAASYSNMSAVFSKRDQMKKAVEYEETALSLRRSINDLQGAASSLQNLGNMYSESKDFEKGLQFQMESLAIREGMGLQDSISSSLLGISQTHFSMGKLEKALDFAERSYKISEQIGALSQMRSILEHLSRVTSAMENYKKAWEWQNRLIEVKDQLFSEDKNKQLATLETRYEMEKKEQEAEIYRLKNVELLQANQELEQYRNHLEDMVEERTREVQQKQDQLLHADRLASMGEMATGVAHELTQPLTIIRMQSELLYMEMADNESLLKMLPESLETIITQVERASQIASNMRDFSRRNVISGEMTNIQESLNKSIQFFHQQFKNRGIDLEMDIASDLPLVQIQSIRLEQIIINFLNNARYAVLQRSENQSDYQPVIKVNAGCTGQSEKIFIEVADNGIGMSESDRQQCLDPFFTTKLASEGTGLGLSIVQGIVSELEGCLKIETAVNEGTTMRVVLPLRNRMENLELLEV